MKSRSLGLALAATLLGSALIYEVMPGQTKDGYWTHNVLRNWEEFGFFRLRGRLTVNPGGHGLPAAPELYRGHRAASLYPAYWVGHLFGGGGFSGLPFYLALAATSFVSIWALLDQRPLGIMAGLAAVLSPGFAPSNLILDPLAVPVWLILPVSVLIRNWLGRERVSAGHWVSAFLVITLYTLLNWATIFGLMLAGGYFLGAPRFSQKRRLALLGLAGAASVLVVVVSLLDKMEAAGSGSAGRGTLATFYNAYLFGPGGYMGYPMSWPKAISRLALTAAVATLPLLAVFLSANWRCPNRKGAWDYLPLAGALGGMLGMRNYFAHHPWMGMCLLMVALIFVMARQHSLSQSPAQNTLLPGRGPASAFVLGVLGYAVVVCLLQRVNAAPSDHLRDLVQSHTHREDWVFIDSRRDPDLAREIERLAPLFDRGILTNWVGAAESSRAPSAQLSGREIHGRLRLGQTREAVNRFEATLESLLNWYSRKIARRTQGDRLETKPVFYLYEFDGQIGTDPARHGRPTPSISSSPKRRRPVTAA